MVYAGLREYLVSPLLTANQSTRFHTHQRTELLGESSSVQLTKSDVRTTRLLDSALTGALGGPALVIFRETFTRLGYPGGPRSMLRAGLTCALIASSLQLLVNQTRVLRLDLLARQDGRPLTTPNDSGRPEEKSTSEQVRDSLRNPSRNPEGDKLGDKSLPGRILTTLSTFLPIQKLSDQEYLEALQRKRGEVDTRLAEIEREEGRIYEYATRGNREV
jgi:hypothetical protein